MPDFIVTEKAQRPARMDGRCFYCLQPIGSAHQANCVLINRKVMVALTIEYEIEVPAHWDAADIEFHRNDGSWCSNNALNELDKIAEDRSCLCGHARYQVLAMDADTYLDES